MKRTELNPYTNEAILDRCRDCMHYNGPGLFKDRIKCSNEQVALDYDADVGDNRRAEEYAQVGCIDFLEPFLYDSCDYFKSKEIMK